MFLVLVIILVVLLEIIPLAVVVAAQSKAWVCGLSLNGVAGSNPVRFLDVCCERCVLPGRGLCGRPIGRLGEYFRVPPSLVCDVETSATRWSKPE
jgi:hypothetical protein